ncbi:hypothetical protein KW842_22455 [Duganella sp. sic0402]|uniref:hypothetical protein n=1 Tax=Duganella sp. sic0402 TaxID=2854786 RepID=UPI001C454175|nr:hypothetical protein [Duganella sp. sic0402]MBV7538543.1 hypothetical protein [Duganella sp. sic0402]
MKPYLAYGALSLLLGGCAITPSVRTVQVLENTGTEFPTMCMLLQSDGSLVFKGGFDFYNPSAWRREGDALLITVGGKAPFPAELYKEQLPKHIGGLMAYDEKRREITYRLNASTEFINFDNFYFYRAERCHAQ